jgi:hypothetical protein
MSRKNCFLPRPVKSLLCWLWNSSFRVKIMSHRWLEKWRHFVFPLTASTCRFHHTATTFRFSKMNWSSRMLESVSSSIRLTLVARLIGETENRGVDRWDL